MFVEVGEHRAVERESTLEITLLQGIARGDRMDIIVQKATELGVTRIVPVMTERSVVKLAPHTRIASSALARDRDRRVRAMRAQPPAGNRAAAVHR